MKYRLILTGWLLGLALILAPPALAQETGSKFFGCIEMQWYIPAEQSSVQITFLKDQTTFARMVLSPAESFRQFSSSAESVFIEGRMRVKYDLETRKGLLRIDSLTYRCYSPSDQWFSGKIVEFDLPKIQ